MEQEYKIFGLTVILVLITIVSLGYIIYKSEKIILIKSEWKCIEYKEDYKPRIQPTGKSVILLPHYEKVCINYKKNI